MDPRAVTFQADDVELDGHLHLPEAAERDQPAPGLVFTGPLTGVKEQVTGTYASHLAGRGFACLAFDHRNFGASSGTPRQHEDPAGKLADLAAAVTFMRGLDEVDDDRIGAVGVCLGTSYALPLAARDPRVEALGLVAGAYNDPRVFVELYGSVEAYREDILAGVESWERYQRTGELDEIAAVSADPDEEAVAMPGPEPHAYYATERGAAATWENRVSLASMANLLTLDAASSADLVGPTPTIVIHGTVDDYCSPKGAKAVFERMDGPKRMEWIETTDHIQLYDSDAHVDQAVDHLDAWFGEHLASTG